MIIMTRSLIVEEPTLPAQLWTKAAIVAVYFCKWTPVSALEGKPPLEFWEDKSLTNPKHVHEWGCVAFQNVERRHRKGDLAPRTRRYHLVGYNTFNRIWRLWDPSDPWRTTNLGELFFRKSFGTSLNQGRNTITYRSFLSIVSWSGLLTMMD